VEKHLITFCRFQLGKYCASNASAVMPHPCLIYRLVSSRQVKHRKINTTTVSWILRFDKVIFEFFKKVK
jgi:hypothetical protein